ncbi:MAG: small multi-drug export protein [Candidatus Caldatribacteriota bacterium]|nr:small multi-drug export protein [Atribacterota bacterium]MDD3030872.1 small multi-drug export protein [Atribacterota bacterium]MDD3640332.1 small multi-drug export protein [Atribacterota bacterium]MDD4288159.1 small multi-drug export protein [Atribacterota bacterium]MDD4764584.1 small multi-drug export protein [Atribacterota bacterium]
MLINLLKITLLSTLPVLELRGSIPIAISYYHLPVLESYIFAVFGNLIPAVFLLLYLKPFSDFLRKCPIFDIFFSWLFKRTRRHEKKYEKYGALFLLFFVAIPLPVTGAWTGSVAAFLFGIRFWYAFPMIAGGVMIAGIIVTFANLGIINLFL